METTVDCPSCGRKLRVTEGLLGQSVQCPSCATEFTPVAESVRSPERPPGETAFSAEPLRAGVALCPECGELVSDEEERCLACGADLGTDDDRPSERPSGPRVRRDCEPHRATLVLVLAITGIVLAFCAPLGLACSIPAWLMGGADLPKMRAGEMDPAGLGTTQAARVCGIVGTGLNGACGLLRGLVLLAEFGSDMPWF